MEKIIYFDYAAVAVLAVILLSAFYRKVGSVNGNRAFLICTAEVLLATVMDICAVYLDNLGSGHAAGKYLFHSAYLVLHTLTLLFYLCYLISLTDSWQKLSSRKGLFAALFAPAAVFLLLFPLNFTGLLDVFHLDADAQYTRGSWFPIGYVTAAIYMVIDICHILMNRKLFNSKWIVTIFAPFPFLIAATAIQFLHPGVLIEMFFNAIALLFIYTNIQKPEELVSSVTGMGNSNAFEEYSRRSYFNRKPEYVLLLDIQSIGAAQEMLSYSAFRVFLHNLADHIFTTAKRHGIRIEGYSGKRGRFYLFTGQKEKEKLDGFACELLDYFNHSLVFQNSELRMESTICIVSVPDDIPDFSDFIRFMNGDLKEMRSGKLYYAKDLLQERYYRILLNINRIVADALSNHRFEIYYQPIYSCRLKRFVSAEALIRLKDPEYGFIPPDIFITAAERLGVIHQISDFVLETVCSFIADPGFKKLGLDYVEVNLSALECVHDNLPERVLRIVKSEGISPRQLALEITETALIYNADKLKENLTTLAETGIMFCLDDYGTGYSDTRRILDLPFSVIKLDRSFQMGIERKFNQVILRDTVKMINDIGHHVVAEGVETEASLKLLEKFGCDMIQGYYFSKPIPRKDFEELCLRQRE